MKELNINELPDFYSVRNKEQIDYSLEGLENMKCFAFFDNGFTSNIIEPNKRDIRFIWDGFLLFVNQDMALDDMRLGTNLWDARLVALQRTDLLGKKFNDFDIREYIMSKLEEKEIPVEVMPDKKEVDGYPSKCDLWSTREEDVLIDAIDVTGKGDAYYFKNADFDYRICFPVTSLPDFYYHHHGALVLKGKNSTAISRLILNDQNLQEHLENIVGEDRLYSLLEGRNLSGISIDSIASGIKNRS